MKKLLFIFILAFAAVQSNAQQIKAYTADMVMATASSPDTVYIINFWATWCAPCVAELPEFNKLKDKYKGKPVRILMVSLDFKQDFPYKLQGFVERKRLAPEVVWLSETDPNTFIPKIENSWQGSIPATLIVQPTKGRKFIEGETSVKEVSQVVDNALKQ